MLLVSSLTLYLSCCIVQLLTVCCAENCTDNLTKHVNLLAASYLLSSWYQPDATGYLAPVPEPPPPSPHYGLSLSPPPRWRLSYTPRRNILVLANIAPVAIFLGLTWPLASQILPACSLTVACLPRFTLCYVYCLPRCFITVGCLPPIALRYVYCLPCCFLTVACLPRFPCCGRTKGVWIRSCVFLGVTIVSWYCMKELCQSCRQAVIPQREGKV